MRSLKKLLARSKPRPSRFFAVCWARRLGNWTGVYVMAASRQQVLKKARHACLKQHGGNYVVMAIKTEDQAVTLWTIHEGWGDESCRGLLS